MATVLLVDDEKAIRTTLGVFFREAGYDVIEAVNAVEAIERVDQQSLDVALLDIRLGSRTGLDVARHIRERQPNVRTILITGEPTFGTANEAIRLRIFDYLVKPIDRTQLLAVVGNAVVAKAREKEYSLLLQERERSHEELERQVRTRTAELKQTTADLRALAAQNLVVREEERKGLARELHDVFGQNLTALHIDLDWMDRHLRDTQPIAIERVRDKIAAMLPLVEHLTEMTQAICSSLRPGMLDDLGLLAAIEWQVEDCGKRTGLACTVLLPPHDVTMDRDCELAFFRIMQEALTNVVRHAQATHVEVRFGMVGSDWELEIKDNGQGFSLKSCSGSKALGLLSMRERAAAFAGTMDVQSESGKGTTVRVRMPMSCRTVAVSLTSGCV
jgi:signal transduction histidine kinase